MFSAYEKSTDTSTIPIGFFCFTRNNLLIIFSSLVKSTIVILYKEFRDTQQNRTAVPRDRLRFIPQFSRIISYAYTQLNANS